MTGRHDRRGGNAAQVDVSQLIERVAQEGRPVRLRWSARIVSDATDIEEWPTGELLRVPPGLEIDSANRDAVAPVATDGHADPVESDKLWGNRGPRPYQDFAATPTSWFGNDAELNWPYGRNRCG